MRFYTWYEILFGTLGAVVFAAVVAGICWLIMKSENKAAAKFKEENPDTAAVWVILQQYSGIEIKKTDGKKAVNFQNENKDPSRGTYILPGRHVITVKYTHTDPAVTKYPEYKKLRVTDMNVILEPGKNYTLLYNHRPGEYLLAEGRPEELENTFL